jgi:hypothetical protein
LTAAGSALALLALVGAVRASMNPAAESGEPAHASALPIGSSSPSPPEISADPRVRAFTAAYGSLIDSVEYHDDDVVFVMGDSRIHFQDGRLIDSERLDDPEQCDPVFYDYPLKPLSSPRSVEGQPRYCTHLVEALWGRTEMEIRQHGRATRFLGHRMFLNDFVVEALSDVESELLSRAEDDAQIATWIDAIDITYTFVDRGIAGSETRSQHAWGLAVDLVPNSYDGKQVYWRWSRVWNREGWAEIPLTERWTPPPSVVATFEKHGFVWGGKWTHFDQIHFEYRPAILLFNRFGSATE